MLGTYVVVKFKFQIKMNCSITFKFFNNIDEKNSNRVISEGYRVSHPFHLHNDAWHDRNKGNTSQFLLNFQKWCYKRPLYTENEKSKLIGRLSSFTNPFISPCDDQVSGVDDLFWFGQHALCYCGKVFFKTA